MKNSSDPKNKIIKETFDCLNANQHYLSPGQIKVIKSLKRYYHKIGVLSERQMQVLMEMKTYLINH